MHAQTKRAQTQTLFGAMLRVVVIYFVLTLWALFIAMGYGYRRVEETGLISWIRLPNGVAPFVTLNLTMADVIAYAALFVAILLASTVQMGSTVAAADDIADRRPKNEDEARRQQEELGVYANQAEMAMIVSFGAAFSTLILTVLFGLQEMATAAGTTHSADAHGVGWRQFVGSSHALGHPRVVFMYTVSFLLFLMTNASMPSWKNTGIFRRQVEDNAWEARQRLTLIAKEHDLASVQPIAHPGGAALATLAGYLTYVVLFVLALNLSLSLIAGRAGFETLLTLERWPMLGLLAVLAFMITTTVGSVMLRVHHLQGRSNVLVVASLVLAIAAVAYTVYAEGASWMIALLLVVAVYAAVWCWFYLRAAVILDEKNPSTWHFFFNPPKYLVMRRYEAIRASADRITDTAEEDRLDQP